ncbi:hypothetical protein FDECE_13476 [Fusarium decemcellulare]|nr:hypothetical protein FDECE_13476 [Fusarium decemcellulare]
MAAHIRVESSTSNSSGRNSPPNASAAPSIFLDGTKTPTNPFATPLITSPLPSEKSASGYFPRVNAPRRRFKSSRLVGEYEKPWINDSKRKVNWDSVIFYIGVLIALARVPLTGPQMTLPTPTYTVNLTKSGTCTSRDQRVSEQRVNEWVRSQPCAAVSNSTKGTIINPVRSARLTTAGNKMIKYGKVEVVAKMPKGDWMWPAIWMMPQDSVYGEWPKSGEIDIAESRGNDAETYPLGDHIVSSALHWGTSYLNDAWYKSYGEWGGKRTKYSEGFHTYSLEWSEKYLFTWLDGRLRQIVFFDFTKNRNMWTYGEFWRTAVNNTTPEDPWTQTGRSNTPFDQRFYLILNVAVGGTQGWFPDGMGTKPWADGSDTPMKDFWKANSTWLPTWGPVEDRGMIVKSVKMWQEGAC